MRSLGFIFTMLMPALLWLTITVSAIERIAQSHMDIEWAIAGIVAMAYAFVFIYNVDYEDFEY